MTQQQVKVHALNADDLFELYENGEFQKQGIVIGTTGPESKALLLSRWNSKI